MQTTLFLSATNVWPLPLLAEWFYWSLTVEDGSLSFLFTSVKVSVMSLLEPGTAGGSRETVLDTQHTHYFSHILQYNFIKKKKERKQQRESKCHESGVLFKQNLWVYYIDNHSAGHFSHLLTAYLWTFLLFSFWQMKSFLHIFVIYFPMIKLNN